jgi:hypothetical protein
VTGALYPIFILEFPLINPEPFFLNNTPCLVCIFYVNPAIRTPQTLPEREYEDRFFRRADFPWEMRQEKNGVLRWSFLKIGDIGKIAGKRGDPGISQI